MIRVRRENYQRLGILRYETGAKSFDEIVRKLLDSYEKKERGR